MIIGKDFIWMHFPKCAGSHTERVLYKYFLGDPEISFDKIDPKNVIWHENVQEREKRTGQNLANKVIICNFRRLPSWIISRIQFEEKRSNYKTIKEDYIHGRFHEVNGYLNFADSYVKKYSSREVNTWIRTEYIRQDFEKAFAPFLDLSQIDLTNEFKQKSNVTNYEKDLRKWFTQEDLELLYSSCPVWRNQEKKLYGELLTL